LKEARETSSYELPRDLNKSSGCAWEIRQQPFQEKSEKPKEEKMGKPQGRSEFLIFGSPALGTAEVKEVLSCLSSGWLGTGPRVAQFEKEFARYKGVDPGKVAAVNSCTAALHLSMIVAGLQRGDEVITSPLTFCATVNAIIHAGATPVLADIDAQTMNIDPEEIRKKITPRTKAVIPVHFAGRSCAMDDITALARQHGLKVIEDCAHAIETEHGGVKAGTVGEFACFSFYVTKNVITGEGGMVVAKHKEDIERVKVLALHGMSKDAWHRFGDRGYKHYYVVESGFKYNMMDLQAAIGIHQLRRVEDNWRRRKEIWKRYQEAFRDFHVERPAEPDKNTRHAYHLYCLLIDEKKSGISRDRFLEAMTRRKIGVGVHYLSLPEHPFYQKTFGWQPEHYPRAMKVGRQTVSLPLSPKLTDRDILDVIDAASRALKKRRSVP
jgi:dTDP-4-amino-4,6-dideoxygalactose transaminase